MKKQVVTEDIVRQAHRSGKPLEVSDGAIFTPSAKDALRALKVQLIQEGQLREHLPVTPAFRVVGVATDHGGVVVKKWVCQALESLGVEYRDHGVDDDSESCDYPDKAAEIAGKVQDGTYWRGIVIDGAGIGSAITANKFYGIRAGLVYDTLTANNARAHNNVNMITLGGQYLGKKVVEEIVRIFIQTEFEGGRHQRRIDKIQIIDQEGRK